MRTILEKILEWQTSEIIEGRHPTSITLSPWDKDELRSWMKSNDWMFNPLSTDEKLHSFDRIYGMEIK